MCNSILYKKIAHITTHQQYIYLYNFTLSLQTCSTWATWWKNHSSLLCRWTVKLSRVKNSEDTWWCQKDSAENCRLLHFRAVAQTKRLLLISIMQNISGYCSFSSFSFPFLSKICLSLYESLTVKHKHAALSPRGWCALRHAQLWASIPWKDNEECSSLQQLSFSLSPRCAQLRRRVA